jgi:hypothetical protein
MNVLEVRLLTAEFILDLVDDFALRRALAGARPRPMGALRASLTALAPSGGAREVFPTAPELVLLRNPSGFDLFFGGLRWPDGVARRPLRRPLEDGSYELRIESAYYQVRSETVTLPRPLSPPRTLLLPGFAYPFPDGATVLRGTVQAADGQGAEGAVVTSGGSSAPYRTDSTGQWALVFPQVPSSGVVTVVYTLPDARTQSTSIPLLAGRDSNLSATALRGEVLDGGAGPRSAKVRVEGFSEVPVRPDGAWTYIFGIDQPATRVDVTAVLADGRQMMVTNNNVTPRSTRVVPSIPF